RRPSAVHADAAARQPRPGHCPGGRISDNSALGLLRGCARMSVDRGFYVEAAQDGLNARVPDGPIEEKWTRCKDQYRLVAPNNRRKYTIIVVGTGLAGASVAASLGELGYRVLSFCIQDSPRRAHSIAAQGGINAAKNYQNDGDSSYRLFYDTIKGGDYRSREANVYRLAQLSVDIIDQCVAQGVPLARGD